MVAFNEENDGLPVRGQTAEMSRRRPKAAGLLDGRCAPENFTCPTRWVQETSRARPPHGWRFLFFVSFSIHPRWKLHPRLCVAAVGSAVGR